MQFFLDLIREYACCQHLVALPLAEDETWSSWSPLCWFYAASPSSQRTRWTLIARPTS